MQSVIPLKLRGPVATIDHASMVYGSGMAKVRALQDVCLEVRRGEVLLLMGPSGSGKTTLLQILGGLLQPTNGGVFFEDQRIGDLDDTALCALRLRRFGFVFQNYNLFPTLTALENVAIACELQGTGRQDGARRAWGLLSYVGLADRMNAYPDSLSGGQKQRVAIARAIAGDPDVVLADEPTAALDTTNGMRVAALLKDLAHHESRAIVIVTHDPRLLKIADRIITLEDGRVVASEAVAHHTHHIPQPSEPLR
jgi:putative ABC transport system ATP-binding protein